MKTDDMKGLICFINEYNCVGYGEAEVIETPRHFIIRLYNAGFSENEELESDFVYTTIGSILLIADMHPIKILAFNKLTTQILHKIDEKLYDELRNTKHYKKVDKFEEILEWD